MPLDWKADHQTRVVFESTTGGEQFTLHKVKFPFKVKRALALINGFKAGFTNNERPLGQIEVNTSIDHIETTQNKSTVVVAVVFRLRDKGKDFNDPYEGFVDVGLIIEK
jgi:hypothetical protein